MRFPTVLYLGVAFVTLVLLIRLLFFEAVEIELESSSDKLFAGENETLEINIVERNRMGWRVPFRNPHLDYVCDSGGELVEISFNSDSTSLLLRAKDRPGLVVLNIITEASAFPLYIEIPILAPLARRLDPHVRSTRLLL